MEMKTLTTGQVARRSGVGVETLRFYEREGLIAEPPRNASGYRAYPEEAVAQIQFTKRAKELGFTLKEIKELLSLRVDPDTSCEAVRDQATAKIDDIEGKIRTLQKMKKALLKLRGACSGRGPTSECPILDALEREEMEK